MTTNSLILTNSELVIKEVAKTTKIPKASISAVACENNQSGDATNSTAAKAYITLTDGRDVSIPALDQDIISLTNTIEAWLNRN